MPAVAASDEALPGWTTGKFSRIFCHIAHETIRILRFHGQVLASRVTTSWASKS